MRHLIVLAMLIPLAAMAADSAASASAPAAQAEIAKSETAPASVPEHSAEQPAVSGGFLHALAAPLRFAQAAGRFLFVLPDVPPDDSLSEFQRQSLIQQSHDAFWQRWYWIVAALAVFFGLYLNARRIRAMVATTKTEHSDKMFAEHLNRFIDPGQPVSVRIGAAIGLRRLADEKNPLSRKEHLYRREVVSLFVEVLHDEKSDPELLAAIRRELIDIGGDALQTLVDRHRERFPAYADFNLETPPAWLPLKRYDAETDSFEIDLKELHKNHRYVESRDAIAGIVRSAKRGHLASPGVRLKWPKLPQALKRSVWRKWWNERPQNERWFDNAPRRTDSERGFADCVLIDANLQKARFEHTDLFGARLQHTDLFGARLEHTDLREAQLEHAGLIGAWLQHTYLIGAWLEHADLSRAEIGHADLIGARLQHANLQEARLEHTDLREAQLEHAILFGATLEHVNLHKARLDLARDMQYATWTGSNWWDAESVADEDRAWLSKDENYSEAKNEPLFLTYWERDDKWGGYNRRKE